MVREVRRAVSDGLQEIARVYDDSVRDGRTITGQDVAGLVMSVFGGSRVNFPRQSQIQRAARDAAIREAFNGTRESAERLASENGLTLRQIYNIVNHRGAK